MENDSKFVLGIDIGTSSVKVCLIDLITLKLCKSKCCSYKSEAKCENETFAQQSSISILNAIQSTLNSVSSDFLRSVHCVSICGQMHGVILWQSNAFKYDANNYKFTIDAAKVSDLYTWQDKRCDESFLETLPESTVRVATGYGCATIFWLLRNQFEFVSRFNASGSIMDFIVAMICDLQKPVISIQNAVSFGFCDPKTKLWNISSLEKSNFPVDLLPQIVDAETYELQLANRWLSIQPKTKVFTAFGDTQCAVYAAMRNRTGVAVLNGGTSQQLCLSTSDDLNANIKTVDLFPYFDNKYLIVAASLNGGNVLQNFVDKLRDCIHLITGIDVDTETLWNKLICAANLSDNSEVKVNACIFGERHNPQLKGSITNLNSNTNVVDIFAATCRALIENVFSMITIELLRQAKIKTLVVTGNAFFNNSLLRKTLEQFIANFQEESGLRIEINFEHEIDANVGAATLAASLLTNKKP